MKTSIYKGVYWNSRNNRWIANVCRKYIGEYETEKEAVIARDIEYIKLGKFDMVQLGIDSYSRFGKHRGSVDESR